jgi:hypothetical protein
LEEQAARHVHYSGELYTALAGPPAAPECAIEVCLKRKYIGVGFLDRSMREYVAYTFSERRPKMLFLERAVYQEYRNGTDVVISADEYHFREDGHVFLKKVNYETDIQNTSEMQGDVSGNWEPIPEFGRYEGIARFDRSPSPAQTPK